MELFGLHDKDGKEYKLIRVTATDEIIIQEIITSEPEFKIGDWGAYKNPDGSKCIFYTTKIEDNELWGWEFFGEDGWQCDLSDLLPITPQEIESHLRKICDEKGYKKGVKVNLEPFDKHEIAHNNYFYNELQDAFYIGGYIIYKQGKFAEIIKDKKRLPKTKKEISEFMSTWANRPQYTTLDNFLKDYED